MDRYDWLVPSSRAHLRGCLAIGTVGSRYWSCYEFSRVEGPEINYTPCHGWCLTLHMANGTKLMLYFTQHYLHQDVGTYGQTHRHFGGHVNSGSLP